MCILKVFLNGCKMLQFLRDSKIDRDVFVRKDMLSVRSILKECGFKGGIARKISQYMSSVDNHGIIIEIPYGIYMGGEIESLDNSKPTELASVKDIKRLISYVLHRSRKDQSEIQSILARFGIHDESYQSAYSSVPEKDILGVIQRSIPFKSTQQFRVGKYRVDLYFPDLRLAVSCNEFNHEEYDKSDEIERKQFIKEQLTCTFIEFNPYDETFNVHDVIRRIVEFVTDPVVLMYRQIIIGGPQSFRTKIYPSLVNIQSFEYSDDDVDDVDLIDNEDDDDETDDDDTDEDDDEEEDIGKYVKVTKRRSSKKKGSNK